MASLGTLLRAVGVLAIAAPALTFAAEPAIKVEFRRAELQPTAGYTASKAPHNGKPLYVSDQAELANADIASAHSELDSRGQRYVIAITLTDAGARKLKKLSTEHLDKPLAILLDDKCVMAPTIRSTLSKKIEIAGNFDQAKADEIAAGIQPQSAP